MSCGVLYMTEYSDMIKGVLTKVKGHKEVHK